MTLCRLIRLRADKRQLLCPTLAHWKTPPPLRGKPFGFSVKNAEVPLLEGSISLEFEQYASNKAVSHSGECSFQSNRLRQPQCMIQHVALQVLSKSNEEC